MVALHAMAVEPAVANQMDHLIQEDLVAGHQVAEHQVAEVDVLVRLFLQGPPWVAHAACLLAHQVVETYLPHDPSVPLFLEVLEVREVREVQEVLEAGSSEGELTLYPVEEVASMEV